MVSPYDAGNGALVVKLFFSASSSHYQDPWLTLERVSVGSNNILLMVVRTALE